MFSKGVFYGMLVYDIKVFLSYLVCNVVNVSNAVGFIVTYTTMLRKTLQDT